MKHFIFSLSALLIFLNGASQNFGFPFVDAGPDQTIDCESGPCTTLTANFFDLGETTSYIAEAIDYNPPFPFTGGTPVSVNIDDRWSQILDLPFDFCFFGETYSEFLIGSNGVITFDTTNNNPGGFCPWSFSQSIPNPNLISASINGVYMDINPAVTGSGTINFTVSGEAPNRTLVVNFPNIPYFGSGCGGQSLTSQIVLYETTNIIDVYVQNRPSGCSWNSGNAVIGIQNVGGTQGIAAPGRNTGDWAATNEAWRFIPSGNSVVDFVWLDNNDNIIGNTETISVCPTSFHTYTAQATYTSCNGDIVIERDFVSITPCEIQQDPCQQTIFLEDFGAGVGRFETPYTSYTFQPTGPVEDGEYVVSNTTAGLTPGWFANMTDRTGDENGRMLIVNGDANASDFYRRTLSVNPNTEYTLSAWITTVYDASTDLCPNNGIHSNVIFRIEDASGNVLSQNNTGNIQNGSAPNWIEYSLDFNTLANNEIQLVLINNAPDGCGNDLAIDDISVYTILETPEIVQPNNLVQCEATGNFSVFDLTSQINQILDGQNPTDFEVFFHTSQANATSNTNPIENPESFENTQNPQTLYVRVENTETGCFATGSFDLIVVEAAIATQPEPLVACETSVGSGEGIFNLNLLIDEIMGNQTPPQFTLSFHQSEADAIENNNEIQQANWGNYQSAPTTIWARVTSYDETLDAECFEVVPVSLLVNDAPAPTLLDSYRLCLDAQGNPISEDFGEQSPPILDTGLSDADYIFIWQINGQIQPELTTSRITALIAGTYTVTVIDALTGCETTISTLVVASSPPLNFGVVTSPEFSNIHTITAFAEGLGDYIFRLNDGAFQDEGFWENVAPGINIITIQDQNGCGSVTVEVRLIGYPLFFTPNDDGINDHWNIIGIEQMPSAQIYIFDRHGKLLKQLSPTSVGWDGTFNGNPLPSSDYWFRVEYVEENQVKVFTGHFTLKR